MRSELTETGLIIQLTDYAGNVLEIGDEVVYVSLGYRDLAKATIVKITAMTVFLQPEKGGRVIKQGPKQLLKIITDVSR